MNNIMTIIRRELASFFLSPVAYVIMAVFAVIYGIFFNGVVLTFSIANMEYTFGSLLTVFLFMIPLITMRTIAEEKRIGTDELMMTAPISTSQFVLGKFLAMSIAFLLILSLILIHFVIVLFLGKPDLGPILSSMTGLIFVGLAFTSIGIFTSSLSDSQIISGLLGFGILLIFWLIDWLGDIITGKIGEAIKTLSMMTHYEDFSKGILDSANVVFFLTIIFVFIFLTIRQIEGRRWK